MTNEDKIPYNRLWGTDRQFQGNSNGIVLCIQKVKKNQTKIKFRNSWRFIMSNHKQPKPDNRNNNVERLHDMIENTQAKLKDAETSLEFANPEEQEIIKQKNERRKQSIVAMEKEMKDEMAARKKDEIKD